MAIESLLVGVAWYASTHRAEDRKDPHRREGRSPD